MPDATPSFDIMNDAAYQRALAILLDVGTSIALELKTPSKDISLAARAVAFKQVDEALRRTIITSKHIADSTAQRAAKRAGTRRQIIRTVEDTITRDARPADAQHLRVELLERIDAPEFFDDLDTRSPAELIAELCRDLGIAASLSGNHALLRRTPEDIAILCAQAAAPPGSGLPQWLAAATPQATKNDTPPGIRLKEH